ncbi:TRAP transporter permease [Microaerobacter geothermalis]|uniref:TRAP transporter permease n=1 Tax=Microaerobacter geothermalis TaxID=674972 RepID=UPI001F2A3384|nr:TRAP transporter permease [Microaerobacter geothermalis]MCF6094137.1 TRAP transporter permease [Microaerobacter geothermalis]
MNKNLAVEEVLNEEELLEKYDKEHAFRKKIGKWAFIVSFLAISLTAFQLYTAIFGTLPSQQQRGFHLGLGLGLIFLLYPSHKGDAHRKLPWFSILLSIGYILISFYFYISEQINLPTLFAVLVFVTLFLISRIASGKSKWGIPWYDGLLAFMGVGVGFYQVIFYKEVIFRTGAYISQDYIVAALGVLLVLEAARRAVGLPIVVVASLALLYAYLGPYMPGFLAHRGFSIERIITHSYLSTEGILGIPIAISATFIYLFLFFGVVLRKTGIGQFFNDLAFALTGKSVGGPAKAAVVASAMQGTVTGSSVANTVGSGSFTIPLMKKAGYRPEFAAAVEASASTGGQLMPPIMGAAAFLMIEFTNMPYSQIALAAAIPAVLYFTGIFISVHLESKRMGILGLPKEQLPDLKDLIIKKGYLFLPLIAIIAILVSGQSPMKAAYMGILTAFIVSLFRKETRMNFRDILHTFEEGAKSALSVIAAVASAGIIVGVVTLTGLGLKVAGGIIDLAGGILLLTLFFTMIASIVLGMGLPTTANYVITATMAAPALLELGVPVIAAHLFVFYFGIVADITPPVALAAYAGSGIARSNPFDTGVTAVKIAIAAFLIPYMFTLSPQLVLVGATPLKVIFSLITAMLGMIGVSSAMMGYLRRSCNWLERLILLVAGLTLINPGLWTDMIGIGALVIVYLLQRNQKEVVQISS